MTRFNWFLQLIIIAGVFSFDLQQKTPIAGFILAAFYFLASLVSLFQRDSALFKKRAFLLAAFIVEIILVSSLVEHPPHYHLMDRLRKMSR